MEIKNRFDVYKELFSEIVLNHDQKILLFSDFDKEYKSFYNSAAVYDSSHSSIFFITGKDAIEFLHRISTQDLINLNEYSSTVTLLLNEKGRIIDRLKIIKFPDHLILIGSPDNGEKVSRWIERYAVMDDIKIKNMTGSYIYLKLLGKKNDILFTLLFGDQIKNVEKRKIYKYITDQFQCWIFHDEIFPHHLGYEILCDGIYADYLLKYINSNLEILNFNFLGFNAYETIRIEQGEPTFPNEINDAFNPYDVNLIQHVSFTKGCYIGQEVIARLDTYDKVKFNFTGFLLEKDYSFDDKLIYKKDESVVGQLTSKTYSPSLKSFVALGLYSKKLTDDDLQNLYVKADNELVRLEIRKIPMVEI